METLLAQGLPAEDAQECGSVVLVLHLLGQLLLGGEHASAQERRFADIEYRADDICLAWLLESVLFDRGWDATFEGEINGVIGSGLFVRFGDVFEGYVPVRRLGGDYYEVNELSTALVGRRTKRTFRLGDPIEVRVAEINRADGKIELRVGSSDN